MPDEQKFKDLVKQEVKNFFGNKIVGDNPTDALQLVNKRYFVTGGPGSVIGYSSILTVDPAKGRLFSFTTTASVATITVNASVAGVYGQQIQVQITNDAAGGRTVLFGQNFRAQSVVGVRSSIATVSFVSNSSVFVEYARAQGI